MKVIERNHIPITIDRRNVKNINLYIKAPYGDVLVTAPRRVSETSILAFLDQKSDWIEKHRNEIIRRSQHQKEQDRYVSEEQKKWLLEQVKELSEKWEPIIGVHCTGWQIRDMKTLWGSCSTKSGRIRMNLQLAKKTKECIEYIVVHELCHLLEPSHNKRFYGFMNEFLPDWQERKRILNGNGY